APTIERLVDRVALGELPARVGTLPAIGVADDNLAPCGFVSEDVLLVVGPPQSGKTSVMASIALALDRADPRPKAYFGAGRSPLRAATSWVETASDEEDVEQVATKLAERLQGGDAAVERLAVFVEDVSSFLNSLGEPALIELIKACRAHGGFVVADADIA